MAKAGATYGIGNAPQVIPAICHARSLIDAAFVQLGGSDLFDQRGGARLDGGLGVGGKCGR